MKRVIFPLLLILLIAACTPESQEQASETRPLVETEAAGDEVQVTATDPALPASPTAPATADATTASVTTASVTTAPVTTESSATPSTTTATKPTATEPVETPTEAAVAVNGRTDDGAYFLGRADAPVTIFEYSDFL